MSPVAIYLPVAGLDVRPGVELLTSHGFRVHELTTASLDASVPRDAVALLAGFDPVGPALFDELPDLRIVATHASGFDMVDVEAARRRSIWVCNLPGGGTEEVAVHALAMALSVLRRLPEWHEHVRRGRWGEAVPYAMHRPSRLRCGVLGLGLIGRHFARLAASVFGEVGGADPYLPDDEWPAGVVRRDVDELFAVSDVVSLHLPLTEGTRGIVTADRLAAMPRDAVLVNASRGALVDEAALLAALDAGSVAAAALDVLAQEPPPPDHPLLHHPRVLASPHVGYLSMESAVEYARAPAENILAWHRTGRPLTPVVEPPG